jgi:hypothetical protein
VKALRALCGLLAAAFVGSSLGAFSLAVYFGATRPTVPSPERPRTLLNHSTTVYLTVMEDRWLVGLFWVAVGAAAMLLVLDRWVNPFGRHKA